jgi:hypothetical protein
MLSRNHKRKVRLLPLAILAALCSCIDENGNVRTPDPVLNAVINSNNRTPRTTPTPTPQPKIQISATPTPENPITSNPEPTGAPRGVP